MRDDAVKSFEATCCVECISHLQATAAIFGLMMCHGNPNESAETRIATGMPRMNLRKFHLDRTRRLVLRNAPPIAVPVLFSSESAERVSEREREREKESESESKRFFSSVKQESNRNPL